MELWDVLDEFGNSTGRTMQRDAPRKPSDFHLVVHVWIVNQKKEVLVSKRALSKPYGGFWEPTGGSVLVGEDSLTGALREVKEELGITLNKEKGTLITRITRQHDEFSSFIDVWLFHQETHFNEIVLQDGETLDAQYVTQEKIVEMIENGIFLPYDIIPYIQELFGNF